MKTFYQISEHQNGNYRHMHIMLYVGKNLQDSNHVGDITFQSNSNLGMDWYGINYELSSSSNSNKIAQLAKIVKKIETNRSNWDAQPSEIAQLLDGEEVFVFYSTLVKCTDRGKYFYKVMHNNEYYNNINCANDILAQRQIDSMNDSRITLGERLLIA
jgi:uncharacterized protein YacL (UPF0231 family)